MGKTVTIWDSNFPTSYEIPVIVTHEFETKSDILGYHAYMNNWKPTIGENLQTRLEPENIIDRYAISYESRHLPVS